MVRAQEDLITTVRDHVKEVTEGKPQLEFFCDDACILRFLRARGMDPKKASVMLSDTLKWCAPCNEAPVMYNDLLSRDTASSAEPCPSSIEWRMRQCFLSQGRVEFRWATSTVSTCLLTMPSFCSH